MFPVIPVLWKRTGMLLELMLEEKGKKSILGNIYVGQVENIVRKY